MVCAFNSLEDFDAIDPARFGFDEKFIASLNLDDLTTQQLQDNLADYHNYIHKDYNADEDYAAMPDFQFLKNIIEDFLIVLSPKDAYLLYREIVKRFDFLKQLQTQKNRLIEQRGPLYLQDTGTVQLDNFGVSNKDQIVDLESYASDSKTSLRIIHSEGGSAQKNKQTPTQSVGQTSQKNNMISHSKTDHRMETSPRLILNQPAQQSRKMSTLVEKALINAV